MYLLAFIITYAVLCVSVAGGARVIWVSIQPGEIFGGWQRVLERLRPKSVFWYKSLGGCVVCMRQRLAEITFAGFVVLITGILGEWPPHDAAPGLGLFTGLIRGILDFVLFVNFCGLALLIAEWAERGNKDAPVKIEEQYPEEKIIKRKL